MEEQVRHPVSGEPGDCPPEVAWIELAAGQRQDDEAAALLEHAAACTVCARELREALAIFAVAKIGEAGPGELPQKELAARMAGTGGGRSARRWISWAAVAAMLVVGVSIVLTRPRGTDILPKLASAYQARRTVELRVPGAEYSALVAERGGGGSVPAELLEARALTQRRLDANPMDAEALHAQGRAALLEWRYEEAITSLRAAADAGRDEVELWIDLGTAYYERAEASQQPVEYSSAVEHLSRALRQRHDDPVALYNRAIAHAKLSLWDAALADMRRFLEVETSPAWRADGQRKLEEWTKRQGVLFHDGPRQLEYAFEESLRVGLRGAAGLSAEMNRKHGDGWLRDALAAALAEDVRAGLARLAGIRMDLRTGDYSREEKTVVALKRAALPEPLAVWRDFEFLFRATHGMRAAECPAATELAARAAKRAYAWFEVQILLEESSCRTNRNDLDGAHERTLRALEVARRSGLRIALSRAQGFHASHAVNEGRYREAFQTDAENLAELQQGGYPPGRVAQPFGNLVRAAERMEHWNTAEAGAAMVAKSAGLAGWRYPAVQALARRAQYAARAGNPAAERWFEEALAAASALPGNEDSANYRAVALTGLYRLRRDAGGLERVQAGLRLGGNLFVELPLLNALSSVYRWQGRAALAEEHAGRAYAMSVAGAARTWARERQEAAQLRTSARLERGLQREALAGWREHLSGGAAEAPWKPGIAVVTVAALDGKVALWTQQGAPVRFRWSRWQGAELRGRIRRMWRLASQRGRGAEAAREAQAMREELFADLEGEPECLILEAGSEVGNLPGGLLQGGRGGEIYFAPLGWNGLEWEPPRRALAIEAGVVHPRWRSELPPLPGLGEEIAAVRGAVGSVAPLRGPEATVAAIRRHLPGVNLLHFAGHALPWRMRTMLAVAPDAAAGDEQGRLGLWEGALQGVEMAVFSACATGMERESVTSGQLAESALRGGARFALASLWPVDSAATARLMTAFYAELAAGQRPGQALRAAAQRLRVLPGYAEPYYWAAFNVYLGNLGKGARQRG